MPELFRLVVSRGFLCLYDQTSKLGTGAVLLHPALSGEQGYPLIHTIWALAGKLRVQERPEWLKRKGRGYTAEPPQEEGQPDYRVLKVTLTAEGVEPYTVPKGEGPVVVLFVNRTTGVARVFKLGVKRNSRE